MARIPLAVAFAVALFARSAPLWADDHGDSCAEATQASRVRLRGRLEAPGDVDVFRLALTPSHVYTLEAYAQDAAVYPRLRVLAEECAATLVDIDGQSPEAPWFIAPASGVVHVEFSTPTGAPFIAYDYLADVLHDDGPATDDLPNTSAEAVPVGVDGAWFHGRVNFRLDRDVLRFRGRAGRVYLIDVTPESAETSPRVAVDVSDGLPGGVRGRIDGPSNDFWFRPEGFAAIRIAVPEGADRDVYAAVKRDGWAAPGAGPVDYRIRIVEEEPLPALWPTSSTCAAPAALPSMGAPFTVRLPERDALAFWRLPAAAGHVYHIETLRAVGPYALTQSGHLDCEEGILGYTQGTSLHVQSPVSGDLLLAMHQGQYAAWLGHEDLPAWATFRVSDLGAIADDVPLGAPARVLAADGQWRMGSTDFPTDSDRYEVAATPGHVHTVELDSEQWRGNVWVSLDGLGGTGWSSGVDLPSLPVPPLAFYVPLDATEPLNLAVAGQDPAPYFVRVGTEPAAGLRGQGCEGPVRVAADGVSRVMVFDPADGEDWFSVETAAGRLYNVTINPRTVGLLNEAVAARDCADPPAHLRTGSFTDFLADQTGPLLVRVPFYGVGEVVVSDLGVPDDAEPNTPDGSVPPAVIVPNRAAVMGRLDYHSDVDCFAVDLRPGMRYTAAVLVSAGGRIDLEVCGVDGSCPLRAPYTSSNGQWSNWRTFQTPAGGSDPARYTVRVRSGGLGAPPDYLLRIYSRTCGADWDDNGGHDTGDLFGFLGAYLGQDPEADVDGSGAIDVGDLFQFLEAWYGPCI